MYTARKYQIINNKQGFLGTKNQKGIKKLCYNMQWMCEEEVCV